MFSPSKRSDAFNRLEQQGAIEVNIGIMKAFVKLRQMLESNEQLNRKFVAIIRKLTSMTST